LILARPRPSSSLFGPRASFLPSCLPRRCGRNILQDETNRSVLVGAITLAPKLYIPIRNLLAIFFEYGVHVLHESGACHGAQHFLKLVTSHVTVGTHFRVQFSRRFWPALAQGAQNAEQCGSLGGRRCAEALRHALRRRAKIADTARTPPTGEIAEVPNQRRHSALRVGCVPDHGLDLCRFLLRLRDSGWPPRFLVTFFSESSTAP